ncbi:MAG TPA: protein imuA [Caulobacteraceae bacterium]
MARAQVAAIETGGAPFRGVLPLGDPSVDRLLPGGGLPLGRWHEAMGEGLEIETAAAVAAFVATFASPLAVRGAVVWVMRRDDLYAPGLAGLGFPSERLIQVCVQDEVEALAALEEALGAVGIAAVIGETDALDLAAGRRLQLACERSGATGFLIRRRPFGGRSRNKAGTSAAATRWRIAPAPSVPEAGQGGLGPPRWRVTLERCRGGRSGVWIMEKADGAHPLRVVADLGDRELETTQSFRLAG